MSNPWHQPKLEWIAAVLGVSKRPFQDFSMTFRARLLSAACALLAANPALAQEEAAPKIALAAELTSDVVTVAAGGFDHKARYLQNLDLIADVDLESTVGLDGTSLHLDLLHNAGAFPNNAVGALQCIDNIEVWVPKLRVFEAWVQKDIGKRTSLRAGVMDLNAEFNSIPSAGLLIAPPFGIGSELAATGPAGPSIFPMTGFGVRLEHSVGKTGYVRAGVFNARPGLHGAGAGSALKFDKGVLAVAQAGIGETQKLSVGVWGYSQKQDNIWATVLGLPGATKRGQGAYMMVEQPLVENVDRSLTAFARFGISDGKTSIFKGSWQAGFLATGVFKSRPDSQASLGVAQGALASGFRNILNTGGLRPAKAESMIEATYSDRIASFLTVQPDILYVIHPGGDARARDAVVLNVRFTFRFEHQR